MFGRGSRLSVRFPLVCGKLSSFIIGLGFLNVLKPESGQGHCSAVQECDQFVGRYSATVSNLQLALYLKHKTAMVIFFFKNPGEK